MASRAKATVAISSELLDAIDGESEARGTTRSAIVEEALRLWQQKKLEQALKRGYQAMAEEDQVQAEALLPLAREAWDEK